MAVIAGIVQVPEGFDKYKVTIQHRRKNKQKTPCFAPSLKGASAFSGFAPLRVGANKGRKCDFLIMLNSYNINTISAAAAFWANIF